MAKRVQLVRHDSAGSAAFIGLIGEVTVNTTNNSLIIHNGVTAGGFELARADLTNVLAASVLNAGKMTAAQVLELTTATTNIATNTAGIATNVTDIATNVTNIATNTANISTLDTDLNVVEAYFTTNILEIAHGGTAAATAANARTNLGLAIGTDVQAYDADLTTLAGLAKTDSNFIVGDGTTWVVESGATVRTSLGLGALAVLSTIDNSLWSGTDLSVANGGTGASTAANARINLSVQESDAGLTSIAALTTVADRMIYATASDVYAVTALTSFARSILDDANANTARATLLAAEITHDHAYVNVTTVWATGTAYIVGDKRQASSPDGNLYFEVTIGGTSHATTEPIWPTVAGDTVVDNAVTWIARDGRGDLLIEESFPAIAAATTYVIDSTGTDQISNTTSTSYVNARSGNINDKVHELVVPRKGTYRCEWEMASVLAGVARSRIYKNGVATGVEKTTTSTSYVTQTDDLPFEAGDLVELYIQSAASDNCIVKNFKLLGSVKLFG